MKNEIKLTEEQTEILEDWKNVLAEHQRGMKLPSRVIVARAGSGKTFICLQLVDMSVAKGYYVGYVMFTNKTVEEFKRKRPNVEAGTSHRFGKEAITLKWKNAKLNKYKTHDHIDKLYPDIKPKDKQDIVKLVHFARLAGVGIASEIRDPGIWQQIAFERDIEPTLDSQAMAVLESMLEDVSCYDMDDMLYLPVYHKLSLRQFDILFVDEAQDTALLQRMLYLRMVKPNGCAIVVGDPKQAIFGFAGSDGQSLDFLSQAFNCERKYLSVSFRCDKAIIELAQQDCPDIKARTDAGPGLVKSIEYEHFISRTESLKNLDSNTAILCRFNAPLFGLSYVLARKNIKCRILGRDMGSGLKSLLNEHCKNMTPAEALTTLAKLAAKKQKELILKPALFEAYLDKINCLNEVLVNSHSISEARKFIDSLYSDDEDDPRLTLSTIHKAKGKEWPRVIIFGYKQYIPSPGARTEVEKEQELNLRYVAVTRARHQLFLVPETPFK